MISIFYIAAIVAVLASIKVISSSRAMDALLYFIISLLATSTVFFVMGAYFSAALVLVLFIGAASLMFLSVLSLLNIKKDVIEQNKRGITPKIWLGPLILAFVLFVTLIYGLGSNDYSIVQNTRTPEVGLIDMLLGAYILVIELAVLLLLGALIIAYHFIHRIYINHDESHQPIENINDFEEYHDSTNA